MEADFRDLLAPPPERPEISNINNVLSIQPLPQGSLAADEYVSNYHPTSPSLVAMYCIANASIATWMRTTT